MSPWGAVISSFYCLNTAFHLDSEFYSFTLDYEAERYSLHCTSSDCYVSLNKNFQSLLGMPSEIIDVGVHTAPVPYDMTAGFSTVYVYCDLADHVRVGSTYAPIICVLGTHLMLDDVRQVEYQPVSPVYTPINKETVSQITIELRGRQGQLVPFSRGEVICVLHIRPRLPTL